MRKSLQTLMAPIMALALAAGALSLRKGLNAWETWASDDPSAVARMWLDESFGADAAAKAIDEALAAKDEELAASFVALAKDRGVAVAAEQRERLAALQEQHAHPGAGAFFKGFFYKEHDDALALAGEVSRQAAEDVLFGDVTDLWAEGSKYAKGEAVDEWKLGLAAFGLATTVSLAASLGGSSPAALPARTGLTALKFAKRTGRIAKPFEAFVTREAIAAVDRDALKAATTAAAKWDFSAALAASGKVLRKPSADAFKALMQDGTALYEKLGARGALQAVALTETGGELRQAARLAERYGIRTRAVLKFLGRSALLVGALSHAAASWLIGAVGYLLALAMLTQRVGFWLGRRF